MRKLFRIGVSCQQTEVFFDQSRTISGLAGVR
jgi:hypothetical protein